MNTERRFRVWLRTGLCLWAWTVLPRVVAAEGTGTHYLLAQPTSYTNVLDAFDGPGLPDLSVALTYKRTLSTLDIARERPAVSERIAGLYRPVARSEQLTHGLTLDLAAGVYRDLMVFVRLPLVLSDKRSFSQSPDAAATDPKTEPADASSTGTEIDRSPLFGHSESSATRSGVPGLDFGVAWGITNQYRTAYLPTWVVQLESRVGLGKVLRPCLADTSCSEAGVSRGTITLALDSRWSYRFSWLEPYLGLRYVMEWATAANGRFSPRGVPDGLDTSLPTQLELTLGAALMTWEDRARFQRISVDVRGQAAYSSAGRDYSALFDVLGASENKQLDAMRRSADLVPIYGLTQVDAYAQLRAELSVAAQAAQYVQFRLGLSFMHMTPHFLTGASACVESCSDSAKNPLYRAVIDLPGQRFMLLGNLSYDLFASATGQF